jgi:hypothetical protein
MMSVDEVGDVDEDESLVDWEEEEAGGKEVVGGSMTVSGEFLLSPDKVLCGTFVGLGVTEDVAGTDGVVFPVVVTLVVLAPTSLVVLVVLAELAAAVVLLTVFLVVVIGLVAFLVVVDLVVFVVIGRTGVVRVVVFLL